MAPLLTADDYYEKLKNHTDHCPRIM